MTNSGQSNFVTIFSWVLIVQAGIVLFSTIQSILMFLGIYFIMDSPVPDNVVPLSGIFLFSALTLVISRAMLNRKEWAWKLVLVLLTVVILALAGVLIMSLLSFVQLRAFNGEEELLMPNSAYLIVYQRVLFIIMFLAIGFFLGWLVKRLLSEDVRNEFTS